MAASGVLVQVAMAQEVTAAVKEVAAVICSEMRRYVQHVEWLKVSGKVLQQWDGVSWKV
jgi:hypothetical protein